jgi:hypothetical protein
MQLIWRPKGSTPSTLSVRSVEKLSNFVACEMHRGESYWTTMV